MNFNKILNKLISIKPEWSTAKNLKIEQLSGGISNLIFKISADNYDTILIRFYGKTMNILIDREEEIKIFKLMSNNKLGPKLLGYFDEGRIEQYIDSITLTNKTIIDHSVSIIKKMKEIHRLNYSEELVCWNRLLKWINLLEKNYFAEYKNEINNLMNEFNNFPKDNYFLKKVFCHNDLLPTNILLDKYNKIHFIDFEYAGNNYLGSDIANHILYFNFEEPCNENHNKFILDFLTKFKEKSPSKIDNLIINYFIKLNYFIWLIWGLLTKDNGEIDFDYIKYIEICRRNYYQLKNKKIFYAI